MRTQLLTLDHLVQLMDPTLYLHLQSADSTNFFFFRMLLVWYKREFSWPDTLHLWETLWTDYLSSNFHLFVALAILEKHRDVIMQHMKHFDEVLKYVNELSGTIDLMSTLVRVEGLFRRFQKTVEAVDKKNNFPAPPTKKEPQSPDGAADYSGSRHGSIAVPGMPGMPVVFGAQRHLANRRASTAVAEAELKAAEKEREKVISPELRRLLSREVQTMDKAEVQEHGGGTA